MALPLPRVGVAALIARQQGDGRMTLVMGLRKGSHGARTWAPPGGHLEFGETLLTCAERETLEETGLRVKGQRVVAVTNDVLHDSELVKHYVTLYILCTLEKSDSQPEVMEPEKCEVWNWIAWEEVRAWALDSQNSEQRLFAPLLNLISTYSAVEGLDLSDA